MANYNGKQANNTAYIKNFVNGPPINLWTTIAYNTSSVPVITTASPKFKNLYIQGDLIVDGNIINPSDYILKKNIQPINIDSVDKLMNLKPSSFTFKDDSLSKLHYGFIAQEFEEEYPELIHNKPDTTYSKIKAINYLEIIPLLVNKIQLMQEEINELKGKLI